MQRLALGLLVMLAFGAGFFKAAQRPQPAAFREPPAPATSHAPALLQSRFASSRQGAQTHAATLVELKDGRLRAFWFSGSREGAPDVEIHSAVFDPASGQWGAEQSVIDRVRTQRALQRYIAKLGNPVAGRAADGSLWLYYVTVSLGGWAGSSITAMRSSDEGDTWSAPRRLITSPFLNVSTLVRNAPFQYEDGTLGFPVYHEFITKFGELLRLDGQSAVLDKQRLAPGGSGALQPVMLVQDRNDARVLMRHSGPPPHRALAIVTQDAGQSWTAPVSSSLPNPDSALSAIVLPDGRMLAVLNNVEQGRDELALMISRDHGASWQTVYELENQRGQPLAVAAYMERAPALLAQSDARLTRVPAAEQQQFRESLERQACTPQGCRYEFSYPFLLQTQRGDFHLVYTWNRAFIKHVQFNQAWLDQQAGLEPPAGRAK
ncbi:MAG TPA: sialidase family protein [Gallionellaceae bacterium]